MAKALFEKLVNDSGRTDIKAESAGMAANYGDSASINAVLCLEEDGVDISSHKAKNVTDELIKNSDLVVALAPSHKEMLIHFFPELGNKLVLLGKGIADPYGGNLEIYRKCRDEIKKELPEIFNKVK